MKETAGRAIQFERRQHGAYGSGVEGIPGEEGFKQRINANSELRMSQVQRLSGDAVRRFGASPFTVFERYYGKDDAGNPVTVSVRIPLSASVGKRMPQSIAALAALPPVKPLQPEDLKSLAGTWRGYYRDDKGFEVPLEMAIKEDGSFEAAEDEPVTNRFRGRLSIRDGQIGYSQQNDTGSLSLYEGEGKRIIQGHVGGPREDLPGQPGRATYKVNYLFRLERTQ